MPLGFYPGRKTWPTPYDTDLDRNAANFQPLTPLSFLARAAAVYPDQTAIIHGKRAWTYREFFARAKQLASALAKRGIKRGDTVAVVLPNVPAMLEAHYGVAMAGAVLNSINTRLDAAIIAFTLDHGEAKVLITDREFSKVVKEALGDLQGEAAGDRLRRSGIHRSRRTARQSRIRGFSAPRRRRLRLADAERRMGRHFAELYVRHHRAIPRASSITIAARICWRWRTSSPAPWPSIRSICGRLPMFHCNGWCFPWTLVGGCGHACLPARSSRGADFRRHRHPQGDASVRRADRDVDACSTRRKQERKPLPHVVEFVTAAAPPPESVLGGDEGRRLQRHPRLRPDRDLRAGERQRLAPRMGRAAGLRAGGEESAPGRELSGARCARRARSGNHGSRCRATARRWAK